MAARPKLHDELESPLLPGWPFILVVIGVLIFLAGSLGGFWGIFNSAVPNRVPLPAQTPPEPRLLSHPSAELNAMLSQQRARLQGYHWVDGGKKLISIPIDRAMAIIAARGDKAYAPIANAPPAPAPQVPELLQGLSGATPPLSNAPTPPGQSSSGKP